MRRLGMAVAQSFPRDPAVALPRVCGPAHAPTRRRNMPCSDVSGFSLLELLAVLAITAIVAAIGINSLAATTQAAQLVGARRTVVQALRQARRLCYLEGVSVSASVSSGTDFLEVTGGSVPKTRFRLPTGLSIVAGPSDEAITFRPGGLADNATVGIGRSGGPIDLRVVVNQRGIIR